MRRPFVSRVSVVVVRPVALVVGNFQPLAWERVTGAGEEDEEEKEKEENNTIIALLLLKLAGKLHPLTEVPSI